MNTRRMSAAKRREAILSAVAPLFATHGLAGVTTRRLAEAAGVSEALLFRHFPDKQALYAAACARDPAYGQVADLLPPDLPPSTRRLVITVHRLADLLLARHSDLAARRLCHSLLDDGHLARRQLDELARELFPALSADLQAAQDHGDLEPPPGGNVDLWLLHHLLWGVQLHALPDRPPLDYRCPRFELLQRSVRFALRGLGLRETAIDREYHPARLATA